MEAEMFHAEGHPDEWTKGQTNWMNLILAFCKIVNELKNQSPNPAHESKAVYSEIHTKHIDTLCDQEAECVKYKPDATQ